MDGIILRINENREAELYQEPYTTIECATEEDYKKLERLLNLGKAIEKAYSMGATLIYDVVEKFDGTIESYNSDETIEQLLEWIEVED